MIYHLCQEYNTPYEFAIANFRTNLANVRRSISAAQAEQMEEEAVVILNKLTLGVLQSVGEALPSLKNITDAGQNLLNETGKAGEKILEDTKGVVKNLKNLLPFGGKKNEAGK